jgi:hypothetical protein
LKAWVSPPKFGMAAYSLGGKLDPDRAPAYSGGYGPVWELHAGGLRLQHRRKVRDRQGRHPEPLRPALADFPVGGALP